MGTGGSSHLRAELLADLPSCLPSTRNGHGSAVLISLREPARKRGPCCLITLFVKCLLAEVSTTPLARSLGSITIPAGTVYVVHPGSSPTWCNARFSVSSSTRTTTDAPLQYNINIDFQVIELAIPAATSNHRPLKTPASRRAMDIKTLSL